MVDNFANEVMSDKEIKELSRLYLERRGGPEMGPPSARVTR
jgi:hypothetical protein